jgi:pimeloyl-ACP methyl ester carboxylesterase
VRIAYAGVGRGPPLVKTANWLNHLEYDWESPVWSMLLHALAADFRLIRYDARGNGLSDWEVEDLSFEAFVRDLESVIEASGLDRFALLGVSQGCAVCIAYAVRHLERVSRLVLYGGFARGRRKRGSQQEIASPEAVLTLMRQGWARRTRRSGSCSHRFLFRAARPTRCSGSMTSNASRPRRKTRCGYAVPSTKST